MPKQYQDVLLDDIILSAILAAIDRTGNQTRAAKELGISDLTVRKRVSRGFSDGRRFDLEETSHREYRVRWGHR